MSRGRGLAVAAGILAAVIVGVAVWLWPRGDGPEQDGRELSQAELREIVGADRSFALLENEVFDEAIEGFEALRESLPNESFAARNLVIARLGRLELDRNLYSEAEAERIRTAMNDLAGESESAVPHVLSSRLAKFEGRIAEQIDDLERAVEITPDDASIHVEIWKASEVSDDPVLQERGERALERAHELQPDNLYVLSKILLVRAQNESPALLEALRRAREILAPFAESIESRAHVDVREFIDAGIAALEAGESRRAAGPARGVHNVMQAEPIYQSDRLRVDRHLLSFVVDVPRDLRDRIEASAETEPIPLRFVESELALPNVGARVEALLVNDVDLDGRPDLVVLTTDALHLFARGDDSRFVELASTPAAGYTGVIAVDLDTDAGRPAAAAPMPEAGQEKAAADAVTCQLADPDIVLWGPAGVLIVENRAEEDGGGRHLVPVESADPLGELREATACVVADFDHDGDLDLVVASARGLSLHAGRGDLTFADVSDRSSLPKDVGGTITSLIPVDVDADLDIDFVVSGPPGSAGWLENLRHGNLRWRADDSAAVGRALEVVDAATSRGWTLLAFDDGSLATHRLDDDSPEGLVGSRSSAVPVPAESRFVVADFDNDGREDVVAVGPESALLLRQTSAGGFEPDENAVDGWAGTTAIDFGDLDGDGDLDLVVAAKDRFRLLDNEGGNAHHWLRLGLRAQQIREGNEASSGRVNQHGIGSTVEVRIGPDWHRRIVRRTWTHLGLGPHEEADAVRIVWTNGVPQNIVGAEANAVVCEVQSLKGSCPYLYTWDGERFVFFTDLLWAAPIGLQFADGVHATPRPWEHLRLPGDRLVPRDGFHELRITEELWEVGYFDNVQLIAVDHPATADVYTNEKVGPPAIAEHRLHTVSDPRTPVAIRDGRERDLLPALRERDEVYDKTWQVKHRQGLVEEHVLEIELGELHDPERITLFLTGWVFPTDTSINVALTHDPRFASPRPPLLQVPNERGEWTTVVPFTGFPGGKTKTIALDLSDVFLADDYRVRIMTNMEFYWDHVFFTVNEPPVETRETPLELVTAELRYRGYSRETLPPGLGPHAYDYEDVSTRPKWSPIEGGRLDCGFTRYGEVLELVEAEDDRIVIMGPGDEMVLRFRVPDEPPPAGWRRDYVLRNVGWDKDADLNTVAGQSVEPLPFRGMSAYPYDGVQPYPNSPVLEADRQHFHVRRHSHVRLGNPHSREGADR